MKPTLPRPPRLSGKLWYEPIYWCMVAKPDSVEILPAEIPYGLMIFFGLMCGVVVVGAELFLFVNSDFPDKLLVHLFGPATALGMLCVCEFLRATFRSQQALGPILTLSSLTKQGTMHRTGQSWPFDRIIRWEIVHGWWVTNDRNETSLFDEITELQMVTIADDGGEIAWPIVGAGWKFDRRLFLTATALANLTALPLVRSEVKRPERC